MQSDLINDRGDMKIIKTFRNYVWMSIKNTSAHFFTLQPLKQLSKVYHPLTHSSEK